MKTITGQLPESYADNFVPVLRPGYPVVYKHTPQAPFCSDRTCPCHEHDREALSQVYKWYRDGLITAPEATDIIMGRKTW